MRAWTDDPEPGRYELKYALPLRLRGAFLDLVEPHARPDPHAVPLDLLGGAAPGARGYLVHSLYYDTPRLDDYFDRLAERRVRDRLRVRTYGRPGEGQPIFLENKRKRDDRVVKSRVRLGTADAWVASPDPEPWRPWLDRIHGRDRYALVHWHRLVAGLRRPVTVVHYVREIWVGRGRADDKLRLNLDYAITVTPRPGARDLFAPGGIALLPEDWMVMELKFDRDPPGWMRRLVRALRLVAEPVSKFGLGVARAWRAHRPREVRYLTPHSLRRRAPLPVGRAS